MKRIPTYGMVSFSGVTAAGPFFIGKAICTDYRKVPLDEVWDDEDLARRGGFLTLEGFRDWFFSQWRDFDEDELVEYLEKEVYYIIEWSFPLIEACVEKV